MRIRCWTRPPGKPWRSRSRTAAKHHVPWGISESAFGDLDIHKTYQYAAFGVPELGLKRDLAEKIVIAPYATLLAMSIAPREVGARI